MKKANKLLCGMACSFVLTLCLVLFFGIETKAADRDPLRSYSAGVDAVMDISSGNSEKLIGATARLLNVSLEQVEESTLVMVNVKNSLNIRAVPEDGATKLGKVYKDCGGTIIERKDGWTKLRSGNVVGWANDKYLLFGEDAEALANDVGKLIATVNEETLRVRKDADKDSEELGFLPSGDIVEVLDNSLEDWVKIDFEGQDGYVLAEYVTINFQIDHGETNEEIKARKAAEREAKRHVNYGQYTTDADTTLLLAALIQCEAGGESYEGQVAVGAVVMNRVRSAAYPDSIHGVIYASGQFTPAMSGKVNRVYESGKIKQSCIDAANEALSGVSNVGDLTHFRRNNGRDGLVIGNHVFY